ncbi:MAG: hypothetical protein AAFU33_15285 [Bacteroidota bacterium]
MISQLSLLHAERKLLSRLEQSIHQGQPVSTHDALPFVNHDYERLEQLLRAGIIHLRKHTLALHVGVEYTPSLWKLRLDQAVSAWEAWQNPESGGSIVEKSRLLCEAGELALACLEKQGLKSLDGEERRQWLEDFQVFRAAFILPIHQTPRSKSTLQPWLSAFWEAVEDLFALERLYLVEEKQARMGLSHKTDRQKQVEALQNMRASQERTLFLSEKLSESSAVFWSGRLDIQPRILPSYMYSVQGQKVARKLKLKALNRADIEPNLILSSQQPLPTAERGLTHWWMDFLNQKKDLMRFLAEYSVLKDHSWEEKQALYYSGILQYGASLKRGKKQVEVNGQQFEAFFPDN